MQKKTCGSTWAISASSAVPVPLSVPHARASTSQMHQAGTVPVTGCEPGTRVPMRDIHGWPGATIRASLLKTGATSGFSASCPIHRVKSICGRAVWDAAAVTGCAPVISACPMLSSTYEEKPRQGKTTEDTENHSVFSKIILLFL